MKRDATVAEKALNNQSEEAISSKQTKDGASRSLSDVDGAKVHLVKLCVGAETVDDLALWQSARSAEQRVSGQDPRPRHVTRMWPRRGEALVQGGSIYWVIRGAIQVRQRIETLQPVTGSDGITRCAIVMCPELVRVELRPRGPFQGWRYLNPSDAPPDLSPEQLGEPELPPDLMEALSAFGVSRR